MERIRRVTGALTLRGPAMHRLSCRPSRLRRWSIGIVAALLVSACASAPTLLVSVGDGPVALGPDEGLLVLDVHSSLGITQLMVDRYGDVDPTEVVDHYKISVIHPGGVFRLVRMKAGSYSLKRAPLQLLNVGSKQLDKELLN